MFLVVEKRADALMFGHDHFKNELAKRGRFDGRKFSDENIRLDCLMERDAKGQPTKCGHLSEFEAAQLNGPCRKKINQSPCHTWPARGTEVDAYQSRVLQL